AIVVSCESGDPDPELLESLARGGSNDPVLSNLVNAGDLSPEAICASFERAGLGFAVAAGEGFSFDGERSEEADGGGLTPLIYAARTGAIEAAQVLLDAGADVNQTSRYGWTPLLAATQNRNYQMGKFLLENGADVNIANK